MYSPQQQSQLSRMAAEQRAIQQEMEKLDQDYGESSDVLGNLKNLANEMEKIAEDLATFKIDRSTIQRQQQILSRMLDAQKSVRERELSRKRKAQSGKDYVRKSPPHLLNSKNQDLTGKSLQEALKEGYTPDYEKLIEEYFRRLNQIENE